MRLSTSKVKRSRLQAAGCRLFLLVACSLGLVVYFVNLAFCAPPKVKIQKLSKSRYKLLVDGKPFIIKGFCYNPIPIGKGQAYDFWSDPSQPWLVDGKLMKEMGANTVRFYQLGDNPANVKKVIDDLYRLYGIRSIIGNWVGFWEYPQPAYYDENFRKKIKKEVLDMVETYKDEPGVLLWILGNENNYSFSDKVMPWSSPTLEAIADVKQRANAKAKIYYSFINELAQEIHKIDPNHPVALGNGELAYLDEAKKYCPRVDLVACILYRGKTFGNFFKSIKTIFDKPVLLSEFGCDAYNAYTQKEDHFEQAYFLERQWREIYKNLWDCKLGEGNCLGGTTFEWTDEWWKHNEYDPQGWSAHDTDAGWSNGSYYFDIKAVKNLNMNEEWFGIVALSEGQDPSAKRLPRKGYYVLRDFWANPTCPILIEEPVKKKREPIRGKPISSP